MRARSLFVAFIALWFSGCATPNMQPYADLTASLGATISEDHKATGEQLNGVYELRKEWQKNVYSRLRRQLSRDENGRVALQKFDARLEISKNNRDTFDRNATAIDALMDVAVVYSNKLVEVATAGESGGEAWCSGT